MISENTLSHVGSEAITIPERHPEGVNAIRGNQLWKIMMIFGLSVVAAAEKAEGNKLNTTMHSTHHAVVENLRDDRVHPNITLVASNEKKVPAEDKVDLIEINHFHDDQGRPVFDQVIFYEWSMEDKRYQVRDWRLFKNQNQTPLKDTKTGEFITIWTDFKNKDVLRKTRAKVANETWTTYDPELVERDFLPEGKRRKLRESSPLLKKLEPPSPLQHLFVPQGGAAPADAGHGR